jgi:predicted small lipoprotein YifL
MKAILSIVAMVLLLTACGVKNDLMKPDGTASKTDNDPSRPPYPLGR